MRPLWIAALAIAAPGAGLHSQESTASRLDWWSADSDRVAFVTAHGQACRRPQLTVWAPTDSLDPVWLPHFVDSLAVNVAALRSLIGGPHPWQRIGNRPVVFCFSPGRFTSNATGQNAVFIALTHIRRGVAPFLHEATGYSAWKRRPARACPRPGGPGRPRSGFRLTSFMYPEPAPACPE